MKNIVIKGWMVAAAIFVVMFGGILLTIGTGDWATTRDSEPARLSSGEFNPADIRGSYAFSEIEEFFGVPLNALFKAFMIPEASQKPDFQVKNLEGMFAPVTIDGRTIEIGTDLIRLFTALYTGLPYDAPESEYLPSSAIQVLIDAGKLNADQQAYRQERSFDLMPLAEGEAIEEHEAENEAIAIKGLTTMGELLQYGVTKERFKEITGIDMPGSAVGLRDFVTENGLDMETVKTGLEAALGLTAEVTVPAEAAPSEAVVESTASPAIAEPDASTVDIKGSTTIMTVLDAGLTAGQFAEITGVPVPEDQTMTLKDFVDANGLDMETVKTKILETLEPIAKTSEPEMDMESTAKPEVPQGELSPTVEEPASSADKPETATLEIKGSTSIAAVLEAGVTTEQFAEITGVAAPEDTTIRLKDFVDANGLDMETIRAKILETLAQ